MKFNANLISNSMKGWVIIFLTFIVIVSAMERNNEASSADAKAKIVHQWVSLDFDWDAIGANKTEWIEKGWFIVENCAPSGIKQWQEDIYIAVPRWMPGVPSTLNKIVLNAQGHPILQPFPSIEYQNPNSTNGLKYVQDIEIDSLGRMWILDAGFLNIYQTQDKVFNPPRLIVLDLTDNNKVIVEFEFPSDIAQPFVTFLNDVVVDVANNYAYISNAAGNGGIYGYDLSTNQARFWTDVTTQSEPNNVFNISGVVYDLAPTPSDGIALTPDTDLLFYSPLAGVNLYSLSTSVFRNFSSSSQQIAETVVHRGQKLSQSDGITFANNGNLYYGNLANDAVNYWSLSSNSLSSSNQFTLVQNHQSMQWQDTFAFDNQGSKGSILFMSNRLQLFPYLMDFTGNSGFNFHIFSVYINAKSYLYPLN